MKYNDQDINVLLKSINTISIYIYIYVYIYIYYEILGYKFNQFISNKFNQVFLKVRAQKHP